MGNAGAGGYDAGSVYTRLGADFERHGFDQYDRALEAARREKDVKAQLGGDFDQRQFDEFERALAKAEARAKRRDAYKAALGADFDGRAFNAAERSMRQYERQSNRVASSTRELDLGLLNLSSRIPLVKWGAFAAGAAAAVPPLVALGGALGPIVGLLGAIPGLAVTALGALTAGSLGMRGVGDALKASWDQQTEAAIGATGAAGQAQAAAERVEDAQRRLNEARKEAAERLRDMRFEAERAAVAEQGSENALRAARQELAGLQAEGVGGLELAEARQRVREAELDLAEARRESTEGARELAAAERGGTGRMPEVVEARREYARAERDAAQAANETTGAAAQLEEKMADLSPAGEKFVRLVESRFFPLFRRLRNEAQEGLLPGVGRGLIQAERNFPVLERMVGRYADALGDAAEQQGRLWGSRAQGRDLEDIFGQGERFLRRSADASVDWARGLTHVAVAADPLLDWAGDMNVELADMLENWARGGRETGRLERFFQRSTRRVELTVEALWDFGRGLINIGSIGSRVWGGDLLRGINGVAERFRAWTESVRGQREIEGYFIRWRRRWREIRDEVDKVIDRYRELRKEGKSATAALAQALTEAFGRALPEIAEGAAKAAPVVALAFVNGFLDANAWGKLALGGWLLAKFGGVGAVRALGGRLAGALFGGMSGAGGAGAAGGKIAGLLGGRGSTPANPLFVADVTGGVGGGKPGGGGGPGGIFGKLPKGKLLPILGRGAGVVGFTIGGAMLAQELGLRFPDNDLSRDEQRRRATQTPSGRPGGQREGVIGVSGDDVARNRERVNRMRRDTENATRGMGDAFKISRREARNLVDTIEFNAIERGRRRVDALAEKLGTLRKGTTAYRETAARLDRAQDRLNKRVRAGEPASERASKGFRGLSRNVENVGETLGLVGTYIVNSTNEILKEFGAKRIEHSVRKFRSGQRGPGFSTNQQGGWAGTGPIRRFPAGLPGFMGGGWLGGSPDLIGDDSILVAAAPGEGFVNRHQRPWVERAMAVAHALGEVPFGSMTEMFSAISRPHMMQSGGIVPVPGFPGELANRAILDEIAFIAKKFPGLVLTDAFGPGHASTGHTVTGTAADFSGPDAVMDAAVRFLVSKGYLVGYDGRFGSENWPDHGPSYVTPNFHLHVEFGFKDLGSAKGGMGAGLLDEIPEIGKVRIDGGTDTTRGILQAAADQLRKGGNRLLERRLADMLAQPVAGGGGRVIHGDGDVEETFARIAKRLSTSRVATLALGMAGYAESGMRDLSYGDSTSQGALQLLASTAASLGVSPHDEGAIASLFLTRGFYHQGANASAAQGLPAHMAAQEAQGSAFSDGRNYLAQEGPARAWMARYGLQRGGLIPRFARGGVIDQIAYLGDSLGVGTLGQGLRGKLGKVRVRGQAVGGKPSPWGVALLRDILKAHRGTDAAVFDLGTNDGTAANLRRSIAAVKRMLGRRPLVMSTVVPKSTDAAAKNRLIRARADHVVDWASVAGPYLLDGIHPNAAGYARRASMIANAVRGLRGDEISGREDGTMSRGWLNELITSGGSPAEIGAQIADELDLGARLGFGGGRGGSRLGRALGNAYSRWRRPGAQIGGLVGVQGFQGGGLVGKGGQLTTRGARRAARWGKGVSRIEDRIEGLGRDYDLKSRRFDLTEEEFILEGDEDTPPALNQDAIERRKGELEELIAVRRKMAMQYGKLVTYLTKLNRLWRSMEGKLEQSIGNARKRLGRLGKGKEANRTRASLEGRIGKWTERLKGVRSSLTTGVQARQDASFDWESTRLDVEELRTELAPLLGGGAGIDLPEWEPLESDDTSADTTVEDIAAQAREQLRIFNENRANLFSEFGRNFQPLGPAADRTPFGDDTERAAGMRHFGAVPGENAPAGVLAGAGGGGQVGGGRQVSVGELHQHFPVQPDPHTWARGTVFELEALG